MTPSPGPGHEAWARDGRPGRVEVGPLSVGGLPPGEAEEFFTRGYRIEAAPAAGPDFPLTSIVIAVHDQFEYTFRCVESIRRLTDERYELIFVDNASTDGTADYLRTIPGARLINNAENRGFPAAVNQGIAASRGEQILLLNNDTIVTTGWLNRMLSAMRGDPRIGLVGPCSNRVSGDQEVQAGYDDPAELDGFAWEWGKAHDRVVEDAGRLIGFCLLIRRAVVDAIGTLDERFGIGCFEDDDYCLRASRAGWRAVIARDAFVHHFGGRTFLGIGADFGAIMRDNGRRFREKWGPQGPPPAVDAPAPPESPQAAAGPFSVAMAPGGGLLLRRGRIRLSLCMIVRDSSRTLPACLESIRPWVDEMVIVDTGSEDDTPAIVESFGGRLFRFPWCDDFSAARNESLRHARGEWLFWMDSDDTITPDCGRRLRELALGEADPAILGFVVRVHCPGSGEDGADDFTAVDHVKLFRNRPDLRFDGRIHEQILPAIREAGGEVAWTDLHVVHSGSEHGREAMERKRRRDMRILRLELEERPEHPFTLFNLGMTCSDGGRHEEAVGFLTRGIAAASPGESHLRKAYALLMFSQMQLGRLDEAERTCRDARALFPQDAELRFRQGVLLHDLGRHEESVRAYRDVLENREGRHFSSVDSGIFGFKARQNLAVAFSGMGDHAAAEREWRLVLAEVPRYRPGWLGLGDALLRQGKLRELRGLAEDARGDESLGCEAGILAGRLCLALGDLTSAREAFEHAVLRRPDDPEARHSLCQFLFEHGAPEEAEHALSRLIASDPADASAHHNLGTLHLRAGRFGEAVAAYEASLLHRRDSPATQIQLGHALEGAGRLDEAVAAWERALRSRPATPPPRRGSATRPRPDHAGGPRPDETRGRVSIRDGATPSRPALAGPGPRLSAAWDSDAVQQPQLPDERGRPGMPYDLILRCPLSPGDVVMLTAAVRDLHLAYPGYFRTDVRTPVPALWENNPYITPLSEGAPGVEVIDMKYDLIQGSNEGAYHFIHGYVQHLEDALGVRIPVTRFKGDIHLSGEEKSWMSQVEEEPIGWRDDFWIIIAGGKYDFTAKWWSPARYQEVVDHFEGKIRFVQCGDAGHWHPRLRGTIDLVGRTDAREFVRLMYHAAGVVCPVTFAMHLAAAVEVRPGRPKNRACVVVAGGREPSTWEKYGHHRFLETNGALPCCDNGGCWKSRCQPVGDGDEKDDPEQLCPLPVAAGPGLVIPRCMDMIASRDVIRAIEQYYEGGALRMTGGGERG
ncbi:glycosyltransferase [Singulisphaera sp. PoT]|uniref:glycosyltransferase n=1 Tax=Singulisphaera sp. PoT TaxID=3411797 RepID=UPI003BF502BE